MWEEIQDMSGEIFDPLFETIEPEETDVEAFMAECWNDMDLNNWEEDDILALINSQGF
jgi:hypothetical protein